MIGVLSGGKVICRILHCGGRGSFVFELKSFGEYHEHQGANLSFMLTIRTAAERNGEDTYRTSLTCRLSCPLPCTVINLWLYLR